MSTAKHRFSEQVDGVVADSKELIGGHAFSSTLLAFGIGVGTGVALVGLCARSPSRHASRTEQLGRQMLEAMSSMIPDSLMHH